MVKRGRPSTGKALVAITLRVPADVAEELKRMGPEAARALVTRVLGRDVVTVGHDMHGNPFVMRAHLKQDGDE